MSHKTACLKKAQLKIKSKSQNQVCKRRRFDIISSNLYFHYTIKMLEISQINLFLNRSQVHADQRNLMQSVPSHIWMTKIYSQCLSVPCEWVYKWIFIHTDKPTDLKNYSELCNNLCYIPIKAFFNAEATKQPYSLWGSTLPATAVRDGCAERWHSANFRFTQQEVNDVHWLYYPLTSFSKLILSDNINILKSTLHPTGLQ